MDGETGFCAEKREELHHLLDYMLQLNRHHNEELNELADSLKEAYPDLSSLIHEAFMQFEAGRVFLDQALSRLDGE